MSAPFQIKPQFLEAKNTLLRIYRIQPLNPIAPFMLLLYDDFGLANCRSHPEFSSKKMVPFVVHRLIRTALNTTFLARNVPAKKGVL
jgi:hypothetical protein